MQQTSKLRKILSWFFALCVLGLFINLVVVFFSQNPTWEALKGFLMSYDMGLATFWLLVGVLVWALVTWGDRIFRRKNLVNWLLTLASVAVALVLFELILAPFSLVFDSANLNGIDFNVRKWHADKNPEAKGTLKAREYWWAKDDQLGYRPLMGPNYAYSDSGAINNGLDPAKAPDKTRVLFVGDSITAYGFTQDALAELNKRPGYEYWNTGVWGYSTWQELKYFERYGRKLKPDVVILGFCLNDWDGTPVILRDEDGQVAIANLHLGPEYFSYWWYQHSTLYRVFLSLVASATDRAGVVENVTANLKRFQDYAKQDGFELRVVVYPELDRLDKWEPRYVQQRAQILKILDKLGIEHYDVAPLLEKALQGRDRAWSRMAPNDHFHPSREFSGQIAAELIKRGYLDPPIRSAQGS